MTNTQVDTGHVSCPYCGARTPIDTSEVHDYCRFCGKTFSIEWIQISDTVARPIG